MASELRGTVTLDSLTRSQWNGLATICLVLLIELAVSVEWLLRVLTGRAWNPYSLAFAFLTVCCLREPIARWIWTPRAMVVSSPSRKDCEPDTSSGPPPGGKKSARHAG